MVCFRRIQENEGKILEAKNAFKGIEKTTIIEPVIGWLAEVKILQRNGLPLPANQKAFH